MWLIASSPTFQSAVGAGSASAAIENVSVETDDTEESGSTRPRAIVNPLPMGCAGQKIALQEFNHTFVFEVSIEADPPSGIETESTREDRLVDETVTFFNLVFGIIADCETNQGIGTGHLAGNSQIAIHNWEMHGWGVQNEVRAEGQAGETANYYYAAVIHFTVTGR